MESFTINYLPYTELHRQVKDIFIQLKGLKIKHYQNPEEVNFVFKEGEDSYNYLKEHSIEQNKLLFNVHQALDMLVMH